MMKRTLTKNWTTWLTVAVAALVVVAFVAAPAFAQRGGRNGTTLAASKTIDICVVDEGTWRYSGEISVWNEGAVDTQGLDIVDKIQNNLGQGGGFFDVYTCSLLDSFTEIPAGTTLQTATVFRYSCEEPPLDGDIRNSVLVTILNHSGSLGTPKGPNPKATWAGGEPPLCDEEKECGCVYTQGYWGNKPGVVWPTGFDRSAPFFNSGRTWQQILDASAGGNGYIILAKQYIAAVLNQENNACVPDGVQEILDVATTFFESVGTPTAACPSPSSCGTQKTWGSILDSYNNGNYPGGPAHCGDE